MQNEGLYLKDAVRRPRVSVLMPVYDASEFLSEAVESILGQTFHDFEFIIVNDGSSDGSRDILEKYAFIDGRIRIINNERNVGIVYSLNRGIDVCSGEYIARMDADDIAHADRLERQIAAMDADPTIAVLGAALSYIDAAGRDLGVIRHCETGISLLSRTPLLHPTTVIRRSILETYGIRYRERYRYAEDYYLWLELGLRGKIAALEDVVLKYRLSGKATRVRCLKGVLRSTLRVKRDAVLHLGMRPRTVDVLRYLVEGALLFLPSSLVLRLYLRMLFPGGAEVHQ